MKKLTYPVVEWRIFKTVLAAAPGWIALDCVAMLASSICYAFCTVVRQWLFDTITDVVSGKTAYQALIGVTVFVVLFQVGNELLNAFCTFTWSPAMKSVAGKLKQKIHRKIAALPGNSFEEVGTLECIEKADQGSDQCYGVYNSVATILLFYVPYFLVLGVYLWRLKPMLVLVVFLIFLPLILNLFARRRIFETIIDETTTLKRERDYYETEIFSRDTCKENRLYGSYHFFLKKFQSVNDTFCGMKWEVSRKTGLMELGLRSLTLLGYLGVVILLLCSMLDGSISVGAFAAVFSSITTMITFMNDAISNYLSTLFDNVGLLKKYLEFFQLPEETDASGEIGWQDKVEVRHVSFRYPGMEENVLEDVSFEIHKGETIAVVGENGAGKSTLVRILTGILRPTQGELRVDGKDLFSVGSTHRFRNVSGVFQQFIRYSMSLRENVEISDKDSDEERVRACLVKSGFSMDEKMTDGYDTMLSREFDGIDLSGGQWQRVALARGLYRSSHFILLDEPTAAIDPIEEGTLYRQFQEMIRDKMGVLVTHRLGSAKIADQILVLKEGRLVEQGNHEELICLRGHYYNLYQEQAKWYKLF